MPNGQTRMVLTPWKCSECGVCMNVCSNKGFEMCIRDRLVGVQDEQDAGHLLCAPGVQKLRGKGDQQSIALFAAVIQLVQRDIAAFQQLLGCLLYTSV